MNHVVGFHTKGAAGASKSMEEETNKIVNKRLFKKEEENNENTPNLEVNFGIIDGDKEQTVGVNRPMKDGQETNKFEEPEEEDTRNYEEELHLWLQYLWCWVI